MYAMWKLDDPDVVTKPAVRNVLQKDIMVDVADVGLQRVDDAKSGAI
jgi:hypothetical protein